MEGGHFGMDLKDKMFLTKFKWAIIIFGAIIVMLSNSLGWEFIGILGMIGGGLIK